MKPPKRGPQQVHPYLPQHLIDKIHAVHQQRKDSGMPGNMSTLWMEIVNTWVASLDPATGMLRPARRQRGKPEVEILTIVPAPDHRKQCVCGAEVFDPSGYDTDAALFAAMDASGRMLWACDAEMQNAHVTPALAALAGKAAREFRREGWTALIHPDDCFTVIDAFRRWSPKGIVYVEAYRLRSADGEWTYILDHAHPRFVKGRLAGYVGSMQDLEAAPASAVHGDRAVHQRRASASGG